MNRISPMAKWFAFLIIATVVMYCVTVASASARPLCVDSVEWTPVIPEHTFVAGIEETVQMGIWQIDPNNPWPAGDLTRAQGWQSNFETKLVDVTNGETPAGFQYDSATGELRYNGNGTSRDVTVRFIQGAVSESPTFRLRVLTPTGVWGANAAAVNAQMGWNAPKVCASGSFSSCRSGIPGGATDTAPQVIFITAGNYSSQDWYLADRPYTYVEGDPRDRPTLIGDALAGGKKRMLGVRNLNLINTSIAHSHSNKNGTNVMQISKVSQCCSTRNDNGVVNPSDATPTWSVDVEVWNSEFIGTGNVGNTVHSFYIESRPNSRFASNNIRVMGSQGSSSLKTTVDQFEVRHSLLSVSRVIGDVSGPCTNLDRTGCLTHTPIDVPAYSNVVIYANAFYIWQQTTVGVPTGKSGILAGAIFIRKREASYGSDVPAFPNISWSPPASSFYGKSPGEGWTRGPDTFVDDDFWAAVKSKPVLDPANSLTFKHFISLNRFILVPGSPLSPSILRDDGSIATKAVYQFGPSEVLPTHKDWIERSVNFLHGNRYEGFPPEYVPEIRLNLHQYVQKVGTPKCGVGVESPCVKWPRAEFGDEVFPHVVDVPDLPPWFRL